MLALVVGAASAAFGANGDAWRLGRANVATKITALGGKLGVNGPMVRLTNKNAGADDTALDLRVQSGEAPMTVNSSTRVNNLNADQLDGQDSTAFVPANTNAFLRNSIYTSESALGPGIDLADGTFKITVSCNPGDVVLSGGIANVNPTSDLVETFGKNNTWAVRIHKNGQADNFSAVALCADQQ